MPTKKDIILFYVLSFTWGIIWTLVGLFTLLFIVLFMDKKVEMSVIAGRIAVRFKNGSFGGASLGIIYLVGRNAGKHTHRHELGHTLQSIWWGPLFIPIIAIPSAVRCGMWNMIRKDYFKRYKEYPNYDDIWFEGQATKLGLKHFYGVVNSALSE